MNASMTTECIRICIRLLCIFINIVNFWNNPVDDTIYVATTFFDYMAHMHRPWHDNEQRLLVRIDRRCHRRVASDAPIKKNKSMEK